MRYPDELKFVDTTTSSTAFDSAGVVVPINLVAQGDDYTNRQGRKVNWKSLLFRATVDNGPSSSSGEVVRIIVFWDLQANGALPAVNAVLQSAVYDSPMNLNNRDRFRVVADKFFTLWRNQMTTGDITGGTSCPRFWNFFKNFNVDTTFGGTTAAIGSINTGALHFLAISQRAAESYYRIWSRVRFTDP